MAKLSHLVKAFQSLAVRAVKRLARTTGRNRWFLRIGLATSVSLLAWLLIATFSPSELDHMTTEPELASDELNLSEGDSDRVEATASEIELLANAKLEAPKLAQTPLVGVGSRIDIAASSGAVLYVDSASGQDRAGRGKAPNTAIKSIGFAVSQAKSGDRIEVAPGSYAPFEIVGKSNIAVQARDLDTAKVSGNDYDRSIGIQISRSNNINIDGLVVRKNLKGIAISASKEVTIVNNKIDDVGQEALSVRDSSSRVFIRNNTISNTGKRPGSKNGTPYSNFGEGVYLGTGKGSLTSSDFGSEIFVQNNEISYTTAEAIDVKPPTKSATISNNRIHHVNTATSGAVVIGINTRVYDSNIVVDSNAISDVTTTSPHADGNAIVVSAAADVRNNVIWNVRHRGILVDKNLRAPANQSVSIDNNMVVGAGLTPVENNSAGKVPVKIGDNQVGAQANALLSSLNQNSKSIDAEVVVAEIRK